MSAKPYEPRRVLGNVANGKRFEVARHRVLGDQLAACRVDQRQRRFHRVEIEIYTARIRHRVEPAVADGQRLAVCEQKDLMRTDAIARMFTDFFVIARHVVDADDAPLSLNVVFRSVEQPPVAARTHHARSSAGLRWQ